ncbi:MAG: hypothetical protein DMF85_17320 [Acidobacteria bacterium]|nr:MAG: hypothetical protein DMF85_17320 [Acidobacteriota bacterium]
MIIALAGRRIDAADASAPRFPAENVELVRTALRSAFERLRASAVVSSAACGADLIALTEAGRLGLRRRVVLPGPADRFRDTSVTDRGESWGPPYDAVVADATRRGDLVIAAQGVEGDAAYAATNHRILDDAIALGAERREDVSAVLVWDGQSRGAGDLTEAFGSAARDRNLPVVEIRTLL